MEADIISTPLMIRLKRFMVMTIVNQFYDKISLVKCSKKKEKLVDKNIFVTDW